MDIYFKKNVALIISGRRHQHDLLKHNIELYIECET